MTQTSTPTLSPLETQLCDVLNVTSLSNALAWCKYLGYGKSCGRCGGTGVYWVASMRGGGTPRECFGCGGAGVFAPKVTQSLIKRCTLDRDSGRLAQIKEAYTLYRQAQKGAADVCMTIWGNSKVSSAYSWQMAADGHPWHQHISDTYNQPFATWHRELQGLERAAQIRLAVPKGKYSLPDLALAREVVGQLHIDQLAILEKVKAHAESFKQFMSHAQGGHTRWAEAVGIKKAGA